MTSLADLWPIFGLSLMTPRLVLRPLRDEDIPRYVEAAASGIHGHGGGRTPFGMPWDESPDLAPNTARWIWECRLRSRPEDWMIMFGIFAHDGALLGSQDVIARGFPTLRTVNTGSWLRRDAQGRGLGTEMRAAVLLWAFDHLGAEVATTSAWDWNAPSLGVSRKLGYEPNGEARRSPRPGVVERELRLRLPPESFRRPEWELRVEGHDAAAAFLGVQPPVV
ncbi:N-acetyltransferase [Sinomonas cyclohexanicum]|uniref:N-acetyltransferase n=1 Tax=Sinomonas cyclohexanicum TaxID=322009 RepID=A0ABN6FFT1_SINCY|nr:GNAT family protein [Corynebacterium cyclohexanicum]BCT75410.1 N-acetyltransferase [Corynebacterium cyclohexanicum]